MHTRAAVCLICAAHPDTARTCVRQRREEALLLTQEAKEEKCCLDDLTDSNFSCTHKSGMGEGEGAAGDSEVGAHQLPFFGKSKQRFKERIPGFLPCTLHHFSTKEWSTLSRDREQTTSG